MKAFLGRLRERVKWWVAPAEMAQLERLRVKLSTYRQWLGEFPDVATTLENFSVDAWSLVPTLNAGTPASGGNDGPWTVQALREVLRARRFDISVDHALPGSDRTIYGYPRARPAPPMPSIKARSVMRAHGVCSWPACDCVVSGNALCGRHVVRDTELSPHTTELNPRSDLWPGCTCAWNQPCINLPPAPAAS